MGPVDDSTAAEDAMRLPGTSEVNAAAVEVPSHGQQEQLPAVSTQDNQHIQTGNNSRMKHWEPRYEKKLYIYNKCIYIISETKTFMKKL